MSHDPQQRLAELGLELPEAPSSAGSYAQTSTAGKLIFTSGQIAVDGAAGMVATGKVGVDVDLELATACARQCALNALAQLAAAGGGLERIERVIKLTVFVASAPDFTEQHKVANGASDLVAHVLGERGVHSRSAVGVAVLPLDSPVEVEAIVQVVVQDAD